MRIVLAVLGIAAVLAGCGSDGEATATSTPSDTASDTVASRVPDDGSALEGTWATEPISQTEAEQTLRRLGLAKWIEEFRPLTFFADETVLILHIEDGEWDLDGKSAGQPRQPIDFDAEYVIDGARVDKIHSTGTTTLGWSVDGDMLSLEWLETSEPPYQGIPDEVFQSALYMTKVFKRE